VEESDDLVVAALDRGATGTVADCERAGWPLTPLLLLPDVPVASSFAAQTTRRAQVRPIGNAETVPRFGKVVVPLRKSTVMFTPSRLPEMVIGTEAARALMLHDVNHDAQPFGGGEV